MDHINTILHAEQILIGECEDSWIPQRKNIKGSE